MFILPITCNTHLKTCKYGKVKAKKCKSDSNPHPPPQQKRQKDILQTSLVSFTRRKNKHLADTWLWIPVKFYTKPLRRLLLVIMTHPKYLTAQIRSFSFSAGHDKLFIFSSSAFHTANTSKLKTIQAKISRN